MAALGTIRKRGVILVCIISFGLFAFIAEEGFRSCDSAKNNERQQIGEVLGEKISVQEFQKLLDEYTEVIKMQQGQENLPEAQMNQIKDMVWNTYVQNQIVAKEASKLGLTVTDAELQDILKTGTNPMLQQTPFVNQQTGRFDAASLQKFLADYKAQKANPSANAQMMEQYDKIFKYWSFIEKTLRQQTLAQKYQSLLAHCFLSNPVEAKMAFKEENEESQIQLAAFPYSDIQDDKVKVEESDLKAKYDELKARFKQPVESRDIKFVDVEVSASQTDRVALNKEFASFHKQLAEAADPAEVVRKSASTVAYLGLPVSKTAFPSDIASELDSLAVGATSAVKVNAGDNTLNIVKLVSKQQLPDSIQYRAIQVAANTVAEAKVKADSIQGAIAGGADFEAVAKKYGQPRRSEILYDLPEEESGAEEESIPDYPVTVFFTREGYLKKIPPKSLRTAGAHKLKEGDEIIYQVETRNNVEALFFTDKQQVYKVRLNELEDGKVAQMGIYLPGRLGMDEGENILAMVITGDYSGYVLFFFAGGKCAKIPLASYATKQNRRKLLKAYSDKEPLAKLLFLPEDTELAIRTSAGRMLLVNTAQIAAKTTRDSQGVAVVTLKKNQTIASVVPAETLELATPHRYRVRSLPATGALIRAEDEGEQLTML